MKRKIFFWGLLLLTGGILNACSDDDDQDEPKSRVEKSFEIKYPGATRVEWEKFGLYERAEGNWQSRELEAWFYHTGAWLCSYTEVSYFSLPEAVKNSVTGSWYASWTPETKADVFEQLHAEKLYIVDIEKGEEDRQLYIEEAGNVVREVAEDYDRDNVPSSIRNLLVKQYPGAFILEGEHLVNGSFMVSFFDEALLKIYWCDRQQNWLYTVWPVVKKDVPQVVLNVLTWEAYKDYQIRKIEYRQYPSGDSYHFILGREGSMDMTVNITPGGQLILN